MQSTYLSSPHRHRWRLIKHQGFSLVELMIVIVIIAVLASIAIPSFQDQVARAHVTAAFSELRALTSAYEDFALRGVTEFELRDLGAKSSDEGQPSQRCEWALVLPDAQTGDGAISCTILGNPRVNGRTLTLQRNGSQGRWSCL